MLDDNYVGLRILVVFALGLLQGAAFIQGMEVWFDIGPILSVICFVVLLVTGVGTIPAAIIAFYGAWKGWHWPWFGAAIAAFPFLIVLGLIVAYSGLSSFLPRKRP